jgi:hypothetical protein
MGDEIAAEAPWVLVEGPEPGDAEFLERWLLAAVQADCALHTPSPPTRTEWSATGGKADEAPTVKQVRV